MKRFLTNLALVLVFVLGLGIALYPTVSDQFNQYRSSLLISDYEVNTGKLTEKDYSELIGACIEYNSALVGGEKKDAFAKQNREASPEYLALLNPEGDGLMGTIEIPKIGVKLPLYHTTADDVLQKGVGHMEGSSMPVGGTGTHAVFAGHRGLPSSKLFTDLDQLNEGDYLIIRVLNLTLYYQVDQILTTEPTEMDKLAIIEGEDHVTLVTCTPYGVNTHRLLVRGKRVYPEDEPKIWVLESSASELKWYIQAAPFAGAILLIELLLYAIFHKREK